MKARKSPHHLSQRGHNRGATSCSGWTRLMGIVISSESSHPIRSRFILWPLTHSKCSWFLCSWAFIQHLTVVGTLLHLFTTSRKRPSPIKPSNQKPSCCNAHHKHQSGGSSCFRLPAPDMCRLPLSDHNFYLFFETYLVAKTPENTQLNHCWFDQHVLLVRMKISLCHWGEKYCSFTQK